MATKIKAVESIIEWDAEMGRMAILNPSDVAEVGDALAAAKIEAGAAKPSKAKAAKAEPEPEPAPEPEPVAADTDGEPADEEGAPV